MPAIRTSRADQSALAIEDLTTIANRSAGLSISLLTPPDRVTVEGVGSKPWHAKVHQRSSLSPREARMLVASATRGAHLVVADQISTGAKEYLASVPSWGWLDRRSELRLRHGSTELEIRLPSATENSVPGGVTLAAPASDGPIRGRAGIAYAASLLLGDPAGPPSIRSVARRAGMAASTVSDAAGLLRDAGLILPSGEPALPALFWALAAVWRPLRANPVASVPDPGPVPVRQSPNLDDLSTEGWAQGGDQAALAWGAPMFALGTVPWIWVPNQITARRVERTLGAATWEGHAAVILVPPTPLGCMDRQDAPSGSLVWPTLHPLYLALDLAQDRARGHEILEGWTPPIPEPEAVGRTGMTTIDLPDDSASLLAVVQTVLSGEVPDAALIGGLAVTARVASTTGYRATNDVDFVTADDAPPTFLEVITARHQVEAPIVIDGIKVDVIPTYDLTEADLADIDDGPRLFVASHRWALDTAETVTLRCSTPTAITTVDVRLATPAALVAAKSHAVGFARSQRRATKHASDLLDVYRLADRYHPPGQLVADLQRAPGRLVRVIASIVRTEYLVNPVKTASAMSESQGTRISADDVAQTMEAFVEDLEDADPAGSWPG